MTRVSKKDTTVTPIRKETSESGFPFSLMRPVDELEKLFDEFMSRNWLHPMRHPSWSHLPEPFQGRSPHVDIIDRDDEVYIKAELPGVNKEDIDISLSDQSVTIKGATRKEEKEEKGDYYRCEISQGSFSRTLALPAEVDTEKVKTQYKGGLLEITIPKMKRAKRRSIKVE